MAITRIDDWEVNVTNSANTLTLTSVSAGNNRLIVCFVTSEAADPVATAISIGGQSGEQVTGSPILFGSGGTAQTVSTWIIKESAIAAKSNNTITITFTTQPTTVSISAAVFADVDQTSPVQEYNEGGSAAATPNPTTTVDLDIGSTDNYAIACVGSGGLYTSTWQADLSEQLDAAMNATAQVSVADASPSSTGNLTVESTLSGQNRRADVSIELLAGATTTYQIDGITKDKDGSALGSVECYLCKDNGDDTFTFVAYQLSNVTTGAYDFTGLGDNDSSYFIVAWKDDTPHVFDVSPRDITPIIE